MATNEVHVPDDPFCTHTGCGYTTFDDRHILLCEYQYKHTTGRRTVPHSLLKGWDAYTVYLRRDPRFSIGPVRRGEGVILRSLRPLTSIQRHYRGARSAHGEVRWGYPCETWAPYAVHDYDTGGESARAISVPDAMFHLGRAVSLTGKSTTSIPPYATQAWSEFHRRLAWEHGDPYQHASDVLTKIISDYRAPRHERMHAGLRALFKNQKVDDDDVTLTSASRLSAA